MIIRVSIESLTTLLRKFDKLKRDNVQLRSDLRRYSDLLEQGNGEIRRLREMVLDLAKLKDLPNIRKDMEKEELRDYVSDLLKGP